MFMHNVGSLNLYFSPSSCKHLVTDLSQLEYGYNIYRFASQLVWPQSTHFTAALRCELRLQDSEAVIWSNKFN